MSTKITESDIHLINNQIKEAFDSRDTEKMLSYFSDDVVIETEIATPNGNQTITFNKTSYKKVLDETFKIAQNYGYSVSNIDINLKSDDTVAEVSSTVSEILTINGQVLNSTSYETTIFRLIEGKPLITSMSSKLAM